MSVPNIYDKFTISILPRLNCLGLKQNSLLLNRGLYSIKGSNTNNTGVHIYTKICFLSRHVLFLFSRWIKASINSHACNDLFDSLTFYLAYNICDQHGIENK
ncbi:Uncharacterised protein [Klebsiella pneumoniae]|nr:Uncharacterised protein [Klebsiella pneumoniae]